MPSEPKSAIRPSAVREGFAADAVRLGDIVFARATAALAPLGLTPLDVDVLICIHDGEGLSQQDLSRQLGLYAPKMVGLIDGLEKQGLVERKISPTDRRRHMLRLTAAGEERLQSAVEAGLALEAELFGCVPQDDKARFKTLVERAAVGANPFDCD